MGETQQIKWDLLHLYKIKKFSIKEIAVKLHVDEMQLRELMKKHEINKLRFGGLNLSQTQIDEIKSMYLDEKLSLESIADILTLSSATIKKILVDEKVEFRTNVTQLKIESQEGRLLNHKKFKQAELDGKKEQVLKLYLDKKLSLTTTSNLVGVSISTLIRWLDANEIPRRPQAEQHRLNNIKKARGEMI